MSTHAMNGKDDGITLIELIVAMGIFSLLMIVTSIFMISGVRSIRDTTGRNSVQQEQQNASEWISRLIRYADELADRALLRLRRHGRRPACCDLLHLRRCRYGRSRALQGHAHQDRQGHRHLNVGTKYDDGPAGVHGSGKQRLSHCPPG